MADKDLNDLFLDTLKDIYYAEKHSESVAEDGEGDELRSAPHCFREAL